MRCFKCGREIREGEGWVFSSEWDAYCHRKCCPAYSGANACKKCIVCEHYLNMIRLSPLKSLQNLPRYHIATSERLSEEIREWACLSATVAYAITMLPLMGLLPPWAWFLLWYFWPLMVIVLLYPHSVKEQGLPEVVLFILLWFPITAYMLYRGWREKTGKVRG